MSSPFEKQQQTSSSGRSDGGRISNSSQHTTTTTNRASSEDPPGIIRTADDNTTEHNNALLNAGDDDDVAGELSHQQQQQQQQHGDDTAARARQQQRQSSEQKEEAAGRGLPTYAAHGGAGLHHKNFSNHNNDEDTARHDDAAAREQIADIFGEQRGGKLPISSSAPILQADIIFGQSSGGELPITTAPIVQAIPISIEIPKDFICPISGEVMRDPVLLVPSGYTYNKKHLCQELLERPHVDPFTQQRYDQKLIYCDNLLVQRMIVRKLGTSAYQQYNDSGFQVQYDAITSSTKLNNDPNFPSSPRTTNSNPELYERIEGLMYGMNSYRIDMERSFELTKTAPKDPIAVAYRAWFLDPLSFTKAIGCPKNDVLASKMWQKAHELGLHQLAESGNRWAQLLEGQRTLLNLEDPQTASIWYQKAADQDHAPAQLALGNLHREGRGVEQSLSVARDLYIKAATHGLSTAQTNLGAMYYFGTGMEEDCTQAVYYFRKAAEQGDDHGQYNLGCMYDLGYGVEQDDRASAFWLERAAEQGHRGAMKKLGRELPAGWSSPGVERIS